MTTAAKTRHSGIGEAAHRREDARLVTGQAGFLGDLDLPGRLSCAFLRSPIAHGVVQRVDVSHVRQVPGVVAAYTASDLDLRDIPELSTAAPVTVTDGMTRPPLARGKVRFVGEPLAVILAKDVYAAADAIEFADADIDPLPALTDVEQALSSEVLLFPELETNVAARRDLSRGEISTDSRWAVAVELETEHPRLAPVSMEPLGIAVQPESDGGLTVWCGTQSPHRLRRQLSQGLDIDIGRIRVIVPDVGGGFGTKNSLYPEYLIVAACARRLGRPILWVATRTENLIIGTHGRAQRHRIRLAGDADGRIRDARIEVLGDVGAYPHNGAVIPMFTAAMGAGPYAVDSVTVSAVSVLTNQAPTGPYRGAGRPEITFSLERAIDAFAHEAGLDAVEVRHRNLVKPSDMPYDNGVGSEYDSGDYAAVLSLAMDLLDLSAVRAEQQRRLEQDATSLLGIGVGTFVERAGASPAPEYARIELQPSGRLIARVGSADTGQGHATTWSQVIADVFAISDLSTIDVLTGDTGEVADGTGSFASRSTQTGGSVVLRCSRELRRRILDLACEALECALADLVMEDGAVGVRGDPSSLLGFDAIATIATERGIELITEESYSLGTQTYPYGTYVAVVEVDRETGDVKIRELIAVDDCGTIVNPEIVEGQIHGSVAQGIGQALFEEFIYDERGQPLTSTLIDYVVPGGPDLPPITSDRLVTPSPTNTLGAKGTGEAGCIGAPPAVVNAVIDALRPLGVTDIPMPLTPQRVWGAISAASADGL